MQSPVARSNPYDGDANDFKVFTLPVTGAVRVYGPEMDVLRTAEFQRLAGLRQLGTAYVVFRGAVHTRFEHSLGALNEAQRLIDAVNRNPATSEVIDGDAQRLIRMTALLHDITHIPFGHSLEDELRLLRRHDENRPRFQRLVTESPVGGFLRQALGDDGFGDYLALSGSARDEDVAQLRFPYAADVVGDTVCADMLDYVLRDLHACGMPVTLGDRFLDFFAITPTSLTRTADRRRMALSLNKTGMPRPDVESEVIKLLTYRYELVERVYFHHAKNAASVMIGRAVWSAGLIGDSTDDDDAHFDWLSDELLLAALASPQIADTLQLHRHPRAPSEIQLASDLAAAVQRRALFKVAYLGVYDDLADRVHHLYQAYAEPAKRRALEDSLAAAAGLPPGRVLVHLPSPKMLQKEAAVRVLTADREVVTLDAWDQQHSRRALALVDAHRRLWRVSVYVDAASSPAQRGGVRSAAEDAFTAPSRYQK
jgi:uncharacterized protein